MKAGGWALVCLDRAVEMGLPDRAVEMGCHGSEMGSRSSPELMEEEAGLAAWTPPICHAWLPSCVRRWRICRLSSLPAVVGEGRKKTPSPAVVPPRAIGNSPVNIALLPSCLHAAVHLARCLAVAVRNTFLDGFFFAAVACWIWPKMGR
ncbi:hypothetical protein ACLOJK_010995 [Asimina triloba]